MMGGLISYLWWGGKDPDLIEPQTGLSPRDIYNLRSTWKSVTADSVASGTEILIRYFKQYPQHKVYFRTFKDMPAEELRNNRQFQAHCHGIIAAFSSSLENIENPELAIVMAQKLGTSHRRFHLHQLQFNDLKEVIVALFIEIKFPPAALESWTRYMTFLYKNIFSALEETQENK